jgi:hypothetical protein
MDPPADLDLAAAPAFDEAFIQHYDEYESATQHQYGFSLNGDTRRMPPFLEIGEQHSPCASLAVGRANWPAQHAISCSTTFKATFEA